MSDTGKPQIVATPMCIIERRYWPVRLVIVNAGKEIDGFTLELMLPEAIDLNAGDLPVEKVKQEGRVYRKVTIESPRRIPPEMTHDVLNSVNREIHFELDAAAEPSPDDDRTYVCRLTCEAYPEVAVERSWASLVRGYYHPE